MTWTARELLIELSIAIIVAIALAAVGPFGTYDASFARRLAYWVPLILLGFAIMRPSLGAAEWLARRLELPLLAAAVAMLALANAPLSLIIYWFNDHQAALPTLDLFFAYYVNVGIVSVIVLAVFILAEARREEAEPAGLPPYETPTTRFHERLPPGFELVALANEDHYVRAYAADGRSELILMRLRDAVEELRGVDGTQVHRGWWVARDAVGGTRREGRRLFLKLDHGLEAPVARDRAAELRSKNWPI